MDWVIIVFVSFFLPLLVLVLFVFHSCERNNGITILEMFRFEKDIQKNLLPLFAQNDCFDIANKYKLVVATDIDSSEINGKESQLGPARDGVYNGEILIAKTDVEYLPRFRCYHELIHYFKDVGKGKKVCRVYGKDPKGETQSHREQIINYYAAAIAVPRDDLQKDLNHFSGSKYDTCFIDELMKKYQQPEATIRRRIEEVSRLSRTNI